MPKSVVLISVPSQDRLQALAAIGQLDLMLREAKAESNNDNPGTFRFTVPGILDDNEIQTVRTAGFRVRLADLQLDVAGHHDHDIDAIAAARRRDIPALNGNRFANAMLRDFDGLAQAGFMNAAEIETALKLLTSAYPDLVTPIRLPQKTHEGRTSLAVRISKSSSATRAVLIAGGFHGREWGSADACVHFAAALAAAYTAHRALTFRNKTFSADQVRAFVEDVEIFIFPDVNPDGRVWSQTREFAWRKNRNPKGAVDINRNFDFKWQNQAGRSTVETHPNYKGRAPFSEPESRNVLYLFDTYPQIRYFMALHCDGDAIYTNWNINHSQDVMPFSDFRNDHFDDSIGPGAYIEWPNHVAMLNRAALMAEASKAAGYQVQVPYRGFMAHASDFFRVAGTAEDFALSRGILDFTFMMAAGVMPPWYKMQYLISGANAAMADLCLSAAAHVYVKDSPADNGTVPSQPPYRDSPSIWVRNRQDGLAGHQNPIAGQDNWVYVRIFNSGRVEARKVEICVTRANPIPGDFEYPRDWASRHPLGQRDSPAAPEHVGSAEVGNIPAGGQALGCVWWKADEVITPTCLLVEVSPNDGPRPTGVHVNDSGILAEKDVAQCALA